MSNDSLKPVKALFIGFDKEIYPDNLICSGAVPSELNGQSCEYSNAGRTPEPLPLDPASENYSIDKGKPGDLCPPCVLQQVSSLQHWQGYKGKNYPEELLPLRLFKCRKGFWLVIPGLLDNEPQKLK
jgi:hypothetical protein